MIFLLYIILILTFHQRSYFVQNPGDQRLYSNPEDLGSPQSSSYETSAPSSAVSLIASSVDLQDVCPRPVASSSVFTPSKNTKKYCIVCRWEGRGRLLDHSIYCEKHHVSLCSKLNTTDPKPWYCQESTWTCWEKFHKYYIGKNLFSVKGNINKTSELYVMKIQNQDDNDSDEDDPSAKKTLCL